MDRRGVAAGATSPRRLTLFFAARYAVPLIALVALGTAPQVAVPRNKLAVLLSAHVLAAVFFQMLGMRNRRALAFSIWTGILADLAFISLMVAVTGGPASPLTFLFTFEAITTGILLSSTAGLRVIAFATGAIIVLEIAREQGIVAGSGHLPVGLAAIAALWVLGGAATLFSAFNERELKRRNAELGVIHQIALDIENTLSLEAVLEHLSRGVVGRLGFNAAAVLIRDGEHLRCVSAAGATGVTDQTLEIRGPLLGAFTTRRPRIVPGDEARRDGALADLLGGRGYVAFPVSAEGLLVVSRWGRRRRPGVVRGHEIEALERLAHHARLALANAKLHESVSTMAITDPLTGLANHGELQRRLGHEMGRLSRYATLRAPGHRVSLLLMDVDYFKKINDKHGHPTGDAILRGIADALRESVRSFDVVARYGGDEFAVILPETDASGARAVADRIRQSIARREFQPPENGSSVPLRAAISIGIATAPENGLVAATLVAAADRALYRSKERGRGCVSHAADARGRLAKVVALRRPVRQPRQASNGDPAGGASRPARERSSRPKRRTPRA